MKNNNEKMKKESKEKEVKMKRNEILKNEEKWRNSEETWTKMKNVKKNAKTQMRNLRWFSKVCLHAQNPRRFPGCAVVAVTCFNEMFDEFHDFSECVFGQKKINNPFWGLTVFHRKSDTFHWTWNKNIHCSNEYQSFLFANVNSSNKMVLVHTLRVARTFSSHFFLCVAYRHEHAWFKMFAVIMSYLSISPSPFTCFILAVPARSLRHVVPFCTFLAELFPIRKRGSSALPHERRRVWLPGRSHALHRLWAQSVRQDYFHGWWHDARQRSRPQWNLWFLENHTREHWTVRCSHNVTSLCFARFSLMILLLR